METKKEIVEFLEKELENAYKSYEEWKNIDHSEATKYRVKSNELEHLLDVLGTEEPKEVKILTKMPKQEKKKKTAKQIIFHSFSFIVFLTSWFFIDSCIYDLVDKIEFLKPVISFVMHFCCFGLHLGWYLYLISHIELLNQDK